MGGSKDGESRIIPRRRMCEICLSGRVGCDAYGSGLDHGERCGTSDWVERLDEILKGSVCGVR